MAASRSTSVMRAWRIRYSTPWSRPRAAMRLCAGTRAGCHSGGRPRAWPRYGRPGGERTRLEQPSRSEIGEGMDANGNLASPAPMPMIRHRFAATRGGAFGSLVPCRRHRRAEPVHLGHQGRRHGPGLWNGRDRRGDLEEAFMKFARVGVAIAAAAIVVTACGGVRRGRQGPQGRHHAPAVGILARQRRPRARRAPSWRSRTSSSTATRSPRRPRPRGQRRPRPAAGRQGHDVAGRRRRGRRRRRPVQLVRGQGPDPDLQRGRAAPVLAREHQPGPHQG